MDFVGHADPYFILTVTTPGGNEAEPAFKYRSHVHYNTGRPVWNEELNFTRVPVGTRVHIKVMDKDHLSAHDPVGDCELVLDEEFLDRAMLATASAESVATASEPCTPHAQSPARSRATSTTGNNDAASGGVADQASGGAGTPGRATSTCGLGDAASSSSSWPSSTAAAAAAAAAPAAASASAGVQRLSLSAGSTGDAGSVAGSSVGGGGGGVDGDAASSWSLSGPSPPPLQFFGLELQMAIRADPSMGKRKEGCAGTLSLGVGCRPCSCEPPAAPGPGPGPGLLHRGPVRYRTASSWVAGKLTGHTDVDSGWRAYAAYKLMLAGLAEFFPGGAQQPWNRKYDKAQQVFNSKALRAAVHTQHNMLYADSGKQKRRGVLRGGGDLVTLLRGGVRGSARRYYTYCINSDGAMCFSETGAKFFSDFMSKHAMHADMAEAVVYAGEFTLVPPGLLPPEVQQQQQQAAEQTAEQTASEPAAVAGAEVSAASAPAGRIDAAEAASDAAVATAAAAACCGEQAQGWTLVIDNNSGTYAPSPAQLAALGSLLRFNFPGLAVALVDSTAPHGKAALAALHRRVPSRCAPPAPAKK
ncbi:hypothetical protein HYH02_012026 [Chlamydomonas schloesseri]|uniref:C2 domain-containing protein n=1 Tax=Chlamydomonas schloesseri TaxID=2026947 RepID=A0A835W2V0_9CHLO|nr:hypothetical protein HYH02_012026 [Chlamydomonas schloesseri]|eukprot:KAG2435029.1 hypothetical protein HYH02_012026 [Chlamydomonas schloesseri]